MRGAAKRNGGSMRGAIEFTEKQRNFLLSPAAKSLKPRDAVIIKIDEAFERFQDIRFGWTGGRPLCPQCDAEHPYVLKRRQSVYPWFRCKVCSTQFSLTSGTCFSGRKAPLSTILHAISLRIHEPSN